MQSVASTVPGGLETPDFLELRKRRERDGSSRFGQEDDDDDDGRPKQLYQVVPEREQRAQGFLGSERAYDISALNGGGGGGAGGPPVLGQEDRRAGGSKRRAGDVDVAIDASELEGMSKEQLEAQYARARQGSAGQAQPQEDFSEFVMQEASKRRKTQEAKKAAAAKEKFKF